MARQCNRENMTKLADALESGEYQQAQSYLQIDDGFCCLGVASDLAALEGVGRWDQEPGAAGVAFHDAVGDGTSRYDLTPGVAGWLGLGDDFYGQPESNIEFQDTNAIALNDHDYSFRDIAERIRAEYLS